MSLPASPASPATVATATATATGMKPAEDIIGVSLKMYFGYGRTL
ncbi:MAG: hypothetical protein JWM13_859, partial [Arthrobacter sp.]|nr:hypothetical protein [Arthrobacter sp.]